MGSPRHATPPQPSPRLSPFLRSQATHTQISTTMPNSGSAALTHSSRIHSRVKNLRSNQVIDGLLLDVLSKMT
jgi:hypothetical protein